MSAYRYRNNKRTPLKRTPLRRVCIPVPIALLEELDQFIIDNHCGGYMRSVMVSEAIELYLASESGKREGEKTK